MLDEQLNYYSDVVWEYFNATVASIIVKEKYNHIFSIEYTNIDKLPDFLNDIPDIVSDTDDNYRCLKEFMGGHLLCVGSDEVTHVWNLYGYYHTKKESDEVYTLLKKSKPAIKQKEGITPIHFWHLAKEAKRSIKHIETPKWSDIMRNYPAIMHEDLNGLMNLSFENLTGGKIILWRGTPGTGKTWAIRSLTNAWKSWCTAHYIIDLDNFLGSSVNYMLSLLTKIQTDDDFENPIEKYTTIKSNINKWNLLILEDAGELIASDAKTMSGNALTKLLNIGDGLLGQGMNLLILITTNQELHDIHTAISRHGRCLSNLEFLPFGLLEKRQWLDDHGHKGELPIGSTLSDLYSVLPNNKRIVLNKTTPKKKMGFI